MATPRPSPPCGLRAVASSGGAAGSGPPRRVTRPIPLQGAAQAAVGMVPLQKSIQRLADRARISLHQSVHEAAIPPPRTADPYGLTKRERLVLQLLAQGRTNAQIGAQLFMSPKTASVHVTNILRKLNVANRTEAAAVAERAGLIDDASGL